MTIKDNDNARLFDQVADFANAKDKAISKLKDEINSIHELTFIDFENLKNKYKL